MMSAMMNKATAATVISAVKGWLKTNKATPKVT